MSIITIRIGSRDFDLACPDESGEHIKTLASKLDEQVKANLAASTSVSFDLALVITALNLQEAKDGNLQESFGEEIERAVKQARKEMQAEMDEILEGKIEAARQEAYEAAKEEALEFAEVNINEARKEAREEADAIIEEAKIAVRNAEAALESVKQELADRAELEERNRQKQELAQDELARLDRELRNLLETSSKEVKL